MLQLYYAFDNGLFGPGRPRRGHNRNVYEKGLFLTVFEGRSACRKPNGHATIIFCLCDTTLPHIRADRTDLVLRYCSAAQGAIQSIPTVAAAHRMNAQTALRSERANMKCTFLKERYGENYNWKNRQRSGPEG